MNCVKAARQRRWVCLEMDMKMLMEIQRKVDENYDDLSHELTGRRIVSKLAQLPKISAHKSKLIQGLKVVGSGKGKGRGKGNVGQTLLNNLSSRYT